MPEKSRLFYKIKALFFTGAMTAATLRGCTYGPPPANTTPPQKAPNSIGRSGEAASGIMKLPIQETKASTVRSGESNFIRENESERNENV